MRVYLDNCCLERPYDDQDQDRIRMEAESVLIVMRLIGRGKLTWVGSEILICESRRIRDPEEPNERDAVLTLMDDVIMLNEPADKARMLELIALGFDDYDASHVAAAEKGNCDVLLTTDDRLLELSRRARQHLRVRVANPVEWVREVIYES
jgi:predicted nucleic acid-binding protein